MAGHRYPIVRFGVSRSPSQAYFSNPKKARHVPGLKKTTANRASEFQCQARRHEVDVIIFPVEAFPLKAKVQIVEQRIADATP